MFQQKQYNLLNLISVNSHFLSVLRLLRQTLMSVPLQDAWRLPLLLAAPVAAGALAGVLFVPLTGQSKEKALQTGAAVGVVIDAFLLGQLWQAIRTFN